MPTLVVNARVNRYDVYIGRPSKWSNPYSHLPYSSARYIVRSREEAIAMYREWLPTQRELMTALHELKGKRLGCPGCNPDIQPCHGHILAELADALP
jgi:hypothetical protein